jgi:hypothetical protein
MWEVCLWGWWSGHKITNKLPVSRAVCIVLSVVSLVRALRGQCLTYATFHRQFCKACLAIFVTSKGV